MRTKKIASRDAEIKTTLSSAKSIMTMISASWYQCNGDQYVY